MPHIPRDLCPFLRVRRRRVTKKAVRDDEMAQNLRSIAIARLSRKSFGDIRYRVEIIFVLVLYLLPLGLPFQAYRPYHPCQGNLHLLQLQASSS